MKNVRREKFITAYRWMFGVNYNQAYDTWKAVRTYADYVDAVITAWEDNARKEFYND